jgi:hypothetical protein
MQKIEHLCSEYMETDIQAFKALARIYQIASVSLGHRRKPKAPAVKEKKG